MPLRVVRRYGWAHSFELEHQPAGARGEPGGEIAARWRGTPADAPFMVHLAEGIDAAARGELPRLEALGCLKPNTVIVHGVALDGNAMRRVARAGAGLVWCPASNVFLFGRTAGVRELLDCGAAGQLALGTDSRLTGSRDMLDELRFARAIADVAPHELYTMATTGAAAMLRNARGGRLVVGAPADLIVVPDQRSSPGEALLAASRRDLRLVVIGGRPLVADPDLLPIYETRRVMPRAIRVDEAPKLAESGLARRIAGCPIAEPGVKVA
jgi:cytosine/adenosine deaminase-related metal-dependent hydrolase